MQSIRYRGSSGDTFVIYTEDVEANEAVKTCEYPGTVDMMNLLEESRHVKAYCFIKDPNEMFARFPQYQHPLGKLVKYGELFQTAEAEAMTCQYFPDFQKATKRMAGHLEHEAFPGVTWTM